MSTGKAGARWLVAALRCRLQKANQRLVNLMRRELQVTMPLDGDARLMVFINPQQKVTLPRHPAANKALGVPRSPAVEQLKKMRLNLELTNLVTFIMTVETRGHGTRSGKPIKYQNHQRSPSSDDSDKIH